MALLGGSCGDDSTSDDTSSGQSDEHAAIAPIRDFRRLQLAQLVLPDTEHDLTVFEALFTGGRESGVLADFKDDAGAMVIEVQRTANSYEVAEDAGDSVVISNCQVQEYVWSDPAEREPYLMTARISYRFDMVLTSEGWRIADFTSVSSHC